MIILHKSVYNNLMSMPDNGLLNRSVNIDKGYIFINFFHFFKQSKTK